MYLDAIHAIPEPFDGQRIVADEQRRNLCADNVGLLLRNRAADAAHALVGLDLHKMGDVAIDAGADRFKPGSPSALCSG